ncbi:MAG: dihydroxyacetone kinase subunit L [Rikenellaceae bacterium]
MKELTIEQFCSMWHIALEDIKANAAEFSRLDAVIGDGDHGEAIVTAMEVVYKECLKGGTFKTMLNNMAFGVMMETSGSTSTLLGALLLGMSDGTSECNTLDGNGVKAMFRSGLMSVQKNTKAALGDKTMMDALIPAVEAIENDNSGDIIEILHSGADAALKGADKTIMMKANFGRARNFGQKSVGSKDSGAASWSTMFTAFYKALK